MIQQHPYLSGLLGDREAAALFSAEAEIAGVLDFEGALARAEAAEGIVSAGAADAIQAALAGFAPDFEALDRGTARDGVVVPALLAQLRVRLPEAHRAALHFGATSQDAVDTSLALRLKRLGGLLAGRLDTLVEALDALAARDGAVEVMAHTRMQAAIPVPAARIVSAWRDPLARGHERLARAVGEAAVLSFGGAAGTLEKLGDKAGAVTRRLADELGLAAPPHARHSERDGLAALAADLSLVSGALGKLGQDAALLAQSEVAALRLAGGGGSSAMPHKVNPVGAEVLVALARFNATLVSAMHQSLVHENERSGAAWTLEWMVLPQMAVATAASLRTAIPLVAGMAFQPRKQAR